MDSENFSRGIQAFNEAKYFEAHEYWELEWKRANEPARSYLKALIQVCGVFVHIEKRRLDPARRLALRALEVFAEAEAHEKLLEANADGQKPFAKGVIPGIDLNGVEECLLQISARLTLEETEWNELWITIRSLRARMR